MGLFKKIGRSVGKLARDAVGSKGILRAAGQAITGKPFKAVGTVKKGIEKTSTQIKNKDFWRDFSGAAKKSGDMTSKLFDNIGGNIRLGKDTNTGLVAIVIAVAAAIAIAFGGGLIRFGKKRRR